MFKYCPSCASERINFNGRNFFCPDCAFTYFHNTAAASGCVIETDGKILLLVRGKEPSIGKLALPGGFVDKGEGVLDGLRREIKEELGWEPVIPPGMPLPEFFRLFASFPNTYLYKNIEYNTCDVFFTISVPGLSKNDFSPDAGEVTDIVFLKPDDIRPEDLSFDSTRRAMEAYGKFSGLPAING